jgi:hypothetical protein
MIENFYTTYFTINRATWDIDTDNNPFSTETEVGTMYGHIQQAEAGLVQSLGLNFSNAYSIWCPVDTQVRAGDTLNSVAGLFSVKAVQKYNVGGNKHLQLVAQLDEVTGS